MLCEQKTCWNMLHAEMQTHYPIQRNVAGDGNCFFRALYKAAESRGMLKVIGGAFQSSESGSCFESGSTNTNTTRISQASSLHSTQSRTNPKEDRFVKCVRNFLSVSIRLNPMYRERLTHMYQLMREAITENQFQENQNAIREVSMDYGNPDWVTSYFVNTSESDTSLEGFIKKCQTQVQKNGTYAGNLDVSLVTLALRKVGVDLVIRTDQDRDTSTMFPVYPKKDTLYLLLKNGNHYNYMEYDESIAGVAQSKESRSKIFRANSEMARDLNAADRFARSDQLQENAAEAKKLHAYYKELDQATSRQSKHDAELALSMSRVASQQRGGAKPKIVAKKIAQGSPRKDVTKLKKVLNKKPAKQIVTRSKVGTKKAPEPKK